MELNIPKINLESELSGVWFPFAEGIKFKVARSNNRNYIKKMAKFRDEYQPLITAGTLKEEEAKRLLAEMFAETILMDWDGIENNGASVEYSVKAGIEMAIDERYRDAVNFIRAKSDQSSAFYEKEVAEQGEE